MRIVDNFIMEMEQEAPATRRVLERIPGDKLSWRPHPKSYSLGELGLHVAQVQAAVANMAKASLDAPPDFVQGEATSVREILDAFDQSIADAKEILNGWTDEQMMATWSMSAGGKELMAMPRAGFIRAIMFNHIYHHRGQLLVYLRLLGQPVPSVYGPTADERLFG